LSLNHHTSHTLHLYLGDKATSSNHRPGSTCIATITPTRILLGIVLLLPFYPTPFLPPTPLELCSINIFRPYLGDRRTAKDGFRGTRDETVKLGETDTGGQVSITQVRPKNIN
jgi:hypothetical protein